MINGLDVCAGVEWLMGHGVIPTMAAFTLNDGVLYDYVSSLSY